MLCSWILAEYDVKTYDEDKLKAEGGAIPLSFEPELVAFNWDPTKEIEVFLCLLTIIIFLLINYILL